jgi:hypothetical protein
MPGQKSSVISPVAQRADLPEDELTGRVDDTPVDEEVRRLNKNGDQIGYPGKPTP